MSQWFIDRRQEFIAATLRQFGQVRRTDLIREFGVSLPQASNDIALFLAADPPNVSYDVSAKAYVLNDPATPASPSPMAGDERESGDKRHEITPADRELWIELEDYPPAWAERVRAGSHDNVAGLQIIARHRLAALSATAKHGVGEGGREALVPSQPIDFLAEAFTRAGWTADAREITTLGPRPGTDDRIALDAIAAALAALSATNGDWRDIESAPKDGTEFQGWIVADSDRERRGYWEPRCRINPDSEAFEIWSRVDYDMDDWDCYSHLSATHWRPLPAAPSALPPMAGKGS